METKPGEISTSDSSLTLAPRPMTSTAKLLLATNGLANPEKHLGILNLKVNRVGTHSSIMRCSEQDSAASLAKEEAGAEAHQLFVKINFFGLGRLVIMVF